MKLTTISSKDGIVLVQCEGEITQADFLDNGNAFTKLLGPECFGSKVLVNMDRATFIDSAGIGWLVISHKQFKETGGMLVVYSVPPMIDHVFRLLHMPTVLHLAANETQALALASGGKS